MNLELARRIAFTLGALLVYRLGSYIPLPGVSPAVWDQMFQAQEGGGLIGMLNAVSGGALARLSVFSLVIVPYVSAAILVQLARFLVPRLRALQHAGEAGRRAIERSTLALTVLIAAFQSYGIAGGLEGVPNLVPEPGPWFRLTTLLTLTAGTLFVTWLAWQITARGVGNGIALILCLGVVLQLPQGILATLELGRRDLLSGNLIAGLALLSVALTALVVAMEKARRCEPVVFPDPRRAPGRLSFKLNGAGVMPALIAAWVLALPLVAVALFAPDAAGFGRAFTHGAPLYMLTYAIVIVFCVYLYTAFVLDPAETAERLRHLGGAIPQVAPGEATAEHLDGVLSRVTLIGAGYFVVICLIPELLISWAQVPFYLGGTSLLVLVCTVLDLETEVRGQMGG
jgi:preprotein translocase subunit SecY